MRLLLSSLAAVLAVATDGALSQTDIEIRGASTDYRYVDLSHTHVSGFVFDALYTGIPDLNLVLIGAGYEFEVARDTSLTPLCYGVSGTDTQGLTLGAYVAAAGRRWRTLGFIGRFFRTAGETPDYTFVDALEFTRVVRLWEIGMLFDVELTEDGPAWLVGPLVKHNDSLGAWGLAIRGGEEEEVRVVRTLSF